MLPTMPGKDFRFNKRTLHAKHLWMIAKNKAKDPLK